MQGLKQEYQDLISNIVTNRLDSFKLILFGSRIRQDHSFCSDIDLAIDYLGNNNNKLDFNLACIREDLEESIIPYEIDLINLNQADLALKNSILHEGTVIYERH